MFNKIYEFLNKILKRNYKGIIFLLCFFLVISYPVPYYIFTSGGITDLSNRFAVDGGYYQEGSYNLSYVTELEGNVLTYLASFVMPSWDLVKVSGYQMSTNESLEDLAMRDKLSLELANQTAVKVAYEKAGKTFKINDTKLYIVYVSEDIEASSPIKVGDILNKINGEEIEDFSQLSSYIDSMKFGDIITFELKRGDDTVVSEVKIRDVDGVKETGIGLYLIYDYEVDPAIKFNFSNKESGSSAGFMTTLAIYDTLIEEDLTHGLKIAGTGTIDRNGTVGEIGGVKYKLKGAVSASSDIFFVPIGDNYNECIKIKEERNYDIDIVAVSSIDDAINYLRNLKK